MLRGSGARHRAAPTLTADPLRPGRSARTSSHRQKVVPLLPDLLTSRENQGEERTRDEDSEWSAAHLPRR
jgi:hypothetical protein